MWRQNRCLLVRCVVRGSAWRRIPPRAGRAGWLADRRDAFGRGAGSTPPRSRNPRVSVARNAPLGLPCPGRPLTSLPGARCGFFPLLRAGGDPAARVITIPPDPRRRTSSNEQQPPLHVVLPPSAFRHAGSPASPSPPASWSTALWALAATARRLPRLRGPASADARLRPVRASAQAGERLAPYGDWRRWSTYSRRAVWSLGSEPEVLMYGSDPISRQNKV